MTIIQLHNLSNKKKKIFTDIIYQNFIKIAPIEKLKHNKNEIYNLVNKQNYYFFVYVIDNKILGYVIGEIMSIDKDQIIYVTYIYISPNHRKKGIGHQLMNKVLEYGSSKDCYKIMLTCDTEDKKVYNWYLKMGFMPDMNFRTYDRYDILSRNV